MNTASSLIRKVYVLSDEEFMEENKKKIINILQKNSYPRATTKRLIETIESKIRSPNNYRKETVDNTNKKYIGLTYIQG